MYLYIFLISNKYFLLKLQVQLEKKNGDLNVKRISHSISFYFIFFLIRIINLIIRVFSKISILVTCFLFYRSWWIQFPKKFFVMVAMKTKTKINSMIFIEEMEGPKVGPRIRIMIVSLFLDSEGSIIQKEGLSLILLILVYF